MNFVPLLEREEESVESSELFTANSVFPLEVWGMLFPGSIGFIQIKMEQLQLTLSLYHQYFSGPASLKSEMHLDDVRSTILYGLSYTKERGLLFATTH